MSGAVVVLLLAGLLFSRWLPEARSEAESNFKGNSGINSFSGEGVLTELQNRRYCPMEIGGMYTQHIDAVGPLTEFLHHDIPYASYTMDQLFRRAQQPPTER